MEMLNCYFNGNGCVGIKCDFNLLNLTSICLVLEEMLLGHAEGLSQRQHSKDHLLSDLVCELDIDEAADCSEQILYEASFKEFGRYSVQYDTIIWLSISLLLVLAWGFGIIMLLYLPYRRHVLQKDFSSRKLYVTPREIVYKVLFYVIWLSPFS